MNTKKALSLFISSSLFWNISSQATWANPQSSEGEEILVAQINRPSPNGICKDHNFVWIENCYEGVQWEKLPNSRHFMGGYDEGYKWVGTNTISRNGDAINFDFRSSAGYRRFSANCKTRVAALILETDYIADPYTYRPVGSFGIDQALDYVCSISD